MSICPGCFDGAGRSHDEGIGELHVEGCWLAREAWARTPTYAAARVRLLSCQRGLRYAANSGLPGTSRSAAHSALHAYGGPAFRRVVEEVKGPVSRALSQDIRRNPRLSPSPATTTKAPTAQETAQEGPYAFLRLSTSMGRRLGRSSDRWQSQTGSALPVRGEGQCA